ncbi:SDR family oxidoreductase [Streptomyces sp. BE230]|uniref:SDR family oxidoreductase n=1 Tax=Streptomyces sp. BE230 TaxID=3002526 RepID=UPI002ED60B24|nr:SDR family NAD(P)-dependent oxidoreductase [Streptomyces sp. BE230]
MSTGVVFGGSSGVGAAVTASRRKQGDTVVCVARNVEPGPDNVQADIRDPDAVDRCVSTAFGRGPVDYVVNCVGIGLYAPLESARADLWKEVFETNVLGLLNVLSSVDRLCPLLRQLIHISSLAALRISETPGSMSYSLSKLAAHHAVIDYRTRSRGQGRPTKVSTVTPGFIGGTAFEAVFSRTSPCDLDLYSGFTPLSSEDVAAAVDYVLALPDTVEVRDLTLAPMGQVR